MLSGAGTGFFQPAIGTNQLQKAVIFDFCLAAARAEHPGSQADSRLDQAACRRVFVLVVFFSGIS